MRARPAYRPAQRGFALLLVLWTVLIIMLLGVAFDDYVARRVENARLIRERLQDKLDAYSTQQTVLFLLSTQRFTRAGVTTLEDTGGEGPERTAGTLRIDPVGGEIALDGTVYRGIGRISFALQDEAGLVPLNSDAAEDVRWLLDSERTAEGEADILIDSLADYRDANTLKRLNGGETAEYAAAGLPPPPNYHLRTAAEVTRVLNWAGWLAEHPAIRLHDWFSASRLSTFNPNVMPEALLARLPGMNATKAAEVVALRREDPFRALPDFDARTDVDITWPEEKYRFFATDSVQIRTWREGATDAMVLALQLTPLGQDSPWLIRSIYRAPRLLPPPDQDVSNEVSGQYFGAGSAAAR